MIVRKGVTGRPQCPSKSSVVYVYQYKILILMHADRFCFPDREVICFSNYYEARTQPTFPSCALSGAHDGRKMAHGTSREVEIHQLGTYGLRDGRYMCAAQHIATVYMQALWTLIGRRDFFAR